MDKCKYYNQEVELTSAYINCMYKLPDCCCGGMLHIVTDDDNVEDDDIKFCLGYIDNEENDGRIDKEIAKLILFHMSNLTMEQRRLTTIGRHWRNAFECPAKVWGMSSCVECIIENENVD